MRQRDADDRDLTVQVGNRNLKSGISETGFSPPPRIPRSGAPSLEFRGLSNSQIPKKRSETGIRMVRAESGKWRGGLGGLGEPGLRIPGSTPRKFGKSSRRRVSPRSAECLPRNPECAHDGGARNQGREPEPSETRNLGKRVEFQIPRLAISERAHDGVPSLVPRNAPLGIRNVPTTAARNQGPDTETSESRKFGKRAGPNRDECRPAEHRLRLLSVARC